jgi:murein DD-endopeptidase MepM/ murein hydrolase activator NlpD
MGRIVRTSRAAFPLRVRRAVCCVGLLLALASCRSLPEGEGVTHVVQPGETVYRISRYYEVPIESVIRANRVSDVTDVAVGTRLFIPNAHRPAATASIALLPGAIQRPGTSGRVLALRESNLVFTWPLHGEVSSRFGYRGGKGHDGIDIRAPRGTPVYAAEAGRVIHAGGGLGDYGKVVILKHVGRYSTVYAHHDSLRVSKGEFVEKGDLIGTVGTSGNASGPHLHFEVRRDRVPADPLSYLP